MVRGRQGETMRKEHPTLSRPLALRGGSCVSIIGAGGKHTLMHRLSVELSSAGTSVVITSTTNLHRNAQLAPLPTVLVDKQSDWRQALCCALGEHRRAVVVGSAMGKNMFRGVGSHQVEPITAAAPEAVVLVKADGARKRLLKVPGPHEPVHPPQVDVCVLVLSLAAIGAAVNEQHVHRLELVRGITAERTITEKTLVDVINAAGGYSEHLAPGARRVLYLSNCTTPDSLAAAQLVCERTQYVFDQQFSGDTLAGKFYELHGSDV